MGNRQNSPIDRTVRPACAKRSIRPPRVPPGLTPAWSVLVRPNPVSFDFACILRHFPDFDASGLDFRASGVSGADFGASGVDSGASGADFGAPELPIFVDCH